MLGLFGVRLCVSLVRLGSAPDAGALAAALRRLSGLEDVRALLLERFMGRAGVLKAQHAVRTVEAALTERPVPEAGALRRRIEGVLAGAHELTELRLLGDLRTGELDLGDDDALLDAERLLGVEPAGDARPAADRRARAQVLRGDRRRGAGTSAGRGVGVH